MIKKIISIKLRYDKYREKGKRENKMNYESTNRGYNFDPIIEYFDTNKTQFEFDEEITFRWKTRRARPH